ncbi:MAG: DUF2867 domain-containing protein [Saprospiraceae bacterium]|nr:DUF2867 domain-containing protein [Saprospiraceae bacterium]
MKIFLTGATGYIGKRLLPHLLEAGHEVFCAVRDRNRFSIPPGRVDRLHVIEMDVLDPKSLEAIPEDIDVVYYLIHSMTTSGGGFSELEARSAQNMVERLKHTRVRQVIYLSGIVNAEELSAHLSSRQQVEEILGTGSFGLTTLRAGIIIGSGSASFEIMRDLVEKLPVMITPRWLDTRSQPIAVRNVLQFLLGVLDRDDTFGQGYDIGGPDIMTYKEMLLRFASIRGLKRTIRTIPVMTPRLSSYWLYFVTATTYPLAVQLVNSMKVEVIGKPNDLAERLCIQLFTFDEAIRMAFVRIEQNEIVSSWKDAMANGQMEGPISSYIQVPVHGCFRDVRSMSVDDREKTLNRIWSLGGTTGWYYGNTLWKWRGYLDKLIGGVGLRRGRTHPTEIHAGDVLDFWRVLLADRQSGRLLLFAEMKLPGEAWLEFRLDEHNVLHQTATFRPKGV